MALVITGHSNIRNVVRPPGLVYTSLRGSTYVKNSFPGANIASNGRPTSNKGKR